MIEEPPLLTVKRPDRRPTEAQIAAFRDLPSSVVSDAMEGAGSLAKDIRHLGHGLPETVAGPALTAGCGPADILALLGALGFIEPGDVVVATVDGHQGAAVFGDRLAGMLRNAGAVAAVTDGPIRDLTGVLPVNLAVWCTGLTPASPFSNGPGTIGLPIRIGGQTVETGDMIVADRDGVVVVPFARIDETIRRSREIIELEQSLDARISKGLKIPDDIAKLLKSDRVRWVD